MLVDLELGCNLGQQGQDFCKRSVILQLFFQERKIMILLNQQSFKDYHKTLLPRMLYDLVELFDYFQ
jgi:hypothetical protein